MSGFKSKKNEKDDLRTFNGPTPSPPCSCNTHAAANKTTSKPPLPISSGQPIEPNPSHLRETLIVGVQVVAKISRRVKSAHVHNTDSLAGIGALGHNS